MNSPFSLLSQYWNVYDGVWWSVMYHTSYIYRVYHALIHVDQQRTINIFSTRLQYTTVCMDRRLIQVTTYCSCWGLEGWNVYWLLPRHKKWRSSTTTGLSVQTYTRKRRGGKTTTTGKQGTWILYHRHPDLTKAFPLNTTNNQTSNIK